MIQKEDFIKPFLHLQLCDLAPLTEEIVDREKVNVEETLILREILLI